MEPIAKGQDNTNESSITKMYTKSNNNRINNKTKKLKFKREISKTLSKNEYHIEAGKLQWWTHVRCILKLRKIPPHNCYSTTAKENFSNFPDLELIFLTPASYPLVLLDYIQNHESESHVKITKPLIRYLPLSQILKLAEVQQILYALLLCRQFT